MIATVIPVKPAQGAKTRLEPVLTADERAELSRTLLVRAVTAARSIGRVAVVSRSPRMRRLAVEHGATALVEDGHDLNAAIRQGLVWAAASADTALVLPGDLPRVTAGDLARLATEADGTTARVVVVPCQRDEGTNALLLRPPDAVAPAFGPDSFARHVAAAEEAGVACAVHRSAAFIDLDTPADWRHLRASVG